MLMNSCTDIYVSIFVCLLPFDPWEYKISLSRWAFNGWNRMWKAGNMILIWKDTAVTMALLCFAILNCWQVEKFAIKRVIFSFISGSFKQCEPEKMHYSPTISSFFSFIARSKCFCPKQTCSHAHTGGKFIVVKILHFNVSSLYMYMYANIHVHA